MRDLRTLFNAAKLKYNDDELGICRIRHYPFIKYKLGATSKTKKRNITLEQIKMIRDYQTDPLYNTLVFGKRINWELTDH